MLPDGETVQVKTYSPILDLWLVDPRNQFTITLTSAPEPGDADFDGYVTGTDRTIWADHHDPDGPGDELLLPSVRRYGEPKRRYLAFFLVARDQPGIFGCAAPPFFEDGFEGGSLNQWSVSPRLKNR